MLIKIATAIWDKLVEWGEYRYKTSRNRGYMMY